MANQKKLRFDVTLTTAAIVFIILAASPSSAQETSSTIPARILPAEDDKPVFTSFDITPAGLEKNRITLVTMKFDFQDDGRNLRGGTMTINFEYSNNSGSFVTYPLTEKVFKNRTGSFEFSFAIHAKKWKWVKIWAWMRDAGGNNGYESDEVTLRRVKPKVKKEGNKVGKLAYDFTLLNKRGRRVKLSDYRGKVVLIDFSTMWCSPCQDEAKHLKTLYKKYKNKGLMIFSVLMEDYTSNPAKPIHCKQWAKTYKQKFPVLADPFWGVYVAYTDMVDPKQIPYNFIIDKNGRVAWAKLGFLPEIATEMENKIVELLNK